MRHLPKKYEGATEGPWEIVQEGSCRVVGPCGATIASTETSALIAREDNARLIADAPILACRVAELEEVAALAQRVLASLTDESVIKQTSVLHAYAKVREAEFKLRQTLAGQGDEAACAVNDNTPPADADAA